MVKFFRPELFLVFLIFLFCLLALAMFLTKNKNMQTQTVCIKEKCFEVEIAQTPEEKRKGLMGRDKLAEDKGMLFAYEEENIYSFWMKNMKFALDIIWIDSNATVIHIAENVPPCQEGNCQSYRPERKATYILEINAGLASKYGIKTGDAVILPENL